MTKWMRFACLAVCVLCTLFCAVGYAAISGNLTISGQVELVALPPPEKVVIIDVQIADVTTGSASNLIHSNQSTVLGSTVSIASGQKVVYAITVKNFSDTVTYAYAGVAYSTEDGINPDVANGNLSVPKVYTDAATTSELAVNTPIAPGATMTFYAVYEVPDGKAVSNADTVFDYKFAVHFNDLGNAAIEGAASTFTDILNNNYQGLTDLLGLMDRGFTGNVVPDGGSGGFANNVLELIKNNPDSLAAEYWGIKNEVGALKQEETASNELFGEGFVLEYMDEETNLPVKREMTTIIQQIDVDGKLGDEMVLFLTPFDFKDTGITSASVRVPVYAAVFTCTSYATDGTPSESGTWFQLGDTYEGAANAASWISTDGLTLLFPSNAQKAENAEKIKKLGNPSRTYNADSFYPNSWVPGKVTTYKEGDGGVVGTVKNLENSTCTQANFIISDTAPDLAYGITKGEVHANPGSATLTDLKTIIQTTLNAAESEPAGKVDLQKPNSDALLNDIAARLANANDIKAEIIAGQYTGVTLEHEKAVALENAIQIATLIQSRGQSNITLAEAISAIRELKNASYTFDLNRPGNASE